MIAMKQRLIKSQGVNVTIHFPAGAAMRSVALLGRSTKPFNNMVSLETHRKGYFLPETAITNGCVVDDEGSGETLLVVAMYRELIKGTLCSLAAHLLECNAFMDVASEGLDADENGNIVPSTVLKAKQLHVYARGHGMDVSQHEHGLLEDGEYLIYSREAPIALLDKLILMVQGKTLRLKVISTDSISFPGVAVIRAAVETR